MREPDIVNSTDTAEFDLSSDNLTLGRSFKSFNGRPLTRGLILVQSLGRVHFCEAINNDSVLRLINRMKW